VPIIGDHPEVGIRIVLDRGPDGPPYVYEGAVFTPDQRFSLTVRVETDGSVKVDGDAPPDLRDKARLMVRTMVRHAQDEEGAPPRRIMRWRAPQT
jgi:hypothetical protein